VTARIHAIEKEIMGYLCPQCLKSDSLEIILSIELSPDSRSDEITLQILTCSSCGMYGVGVYEESRRGPLGEDHWEHCGYQVDRPYADAIAHLIKDCPNRFNRRCSCQAHAVLGKVDSSGRWQGLVQAEIMQTFGLVP